MATIVTIPYVLTPKLYGSEWLVSRSSRPYPGATYVLPMSREIASGRQPIGMLMKKRYIYSHQESNPDPLVFNDAVHLLKAYAVSTLESRSIYS
jgi:hypothetical protein